MLQGHGSARLKMPAAKESQGTVDLGIQDINSEARLILQVQGRHRYWWVAKVNHGAFLHVEVYKYNSGLFLDYLGCPDGFDK